MVKVALLRLARGGLVYGLGGVLQRFLGLLLLPFFTRELAPNDYGVVALITVLTVAMTGLFNLGTGNSMGVLYFREGTETGRRSALVWTNFSLLLVNSLLLYVALYFAAPLLSSWMFQSTNHQELIRLGLLALVFGTLAEPWLAHLRMEQRAVRYVLLTLASSLLTIALSVWLVLVLQRGVAGLLLAGALGQLSLLCACLWFIARKLPIRIDFSFVIPLVRIGFPGIFGLFALLLIDYADRQLIERIVGLDALGVYSVGYSFGMIMAVLVGAFSSAWSPFFMSYVDKTEEAAPIFARVMTYYLLGFGSLVLLFFLAARPLVTLFTAPAFHDAYLVIGLVSAASMLKGCYLIALPGVYFAHKLHLQSLIEWIAAFLNIALNIMLLPRLGITGAALATFLSYVSLTMLAYVVARRYLLVNYEWKRIGSVTITVAAFCALGSWVSSTEQLGIVTTLMVHALILGIFLIVAALLLTSEAERAWLKARLMS